MQDHRLNTNKEPAELIGSGRSYGEGERPAQVQGHRLDTNKDPAELLGGRRRYGEEERPSRHLDKTNIVEGDLEGEGRGREVQGQDNTVSKNEAEGAGRHGTNEAEGAGRQDRYEDQGAGRQGRDLGVEGRGQENKTKTTPRRTRRSTPRTVSTTC